MLIRVHFKNGGKIHKLYETPFLYFDRTQKLYFSALSGSKLSKSPYEDALSLLSFITKYLTETTPPLLGPMHGNLTCILLPHEDCTQHYIQFNFLEFGA